MSFVRIVLATSLESRDDSSEKDGLLDNCFVEATPEGLALLKRAGTESLGSLCSPGSGQGAVSYGSQVIFIACDTLFIAAKYISMTAAVNAGGA